MKKNDISFYLYCTFRFYVSNHPREEQEIIGKTNSKIKKKKRRMKQKAIQNGTANAKLLKKGEKENEPTKI
ncbi:hypothetical protein EL466_09890 [Enterococcus faecium]|nr:hypothetical protein [Enterococcus faecium]EGP5140138.1 hypothetical protein [Enterococcus faecium]PQE65752.1 hypothetical protein CUS10_00190 [Enterococcus faecium]PQG45805.1 hypothetical protein CUS80_06905 [Enterococcus faecium]